MGMTDLARVVGLLALAATAATAGLHLFAGPAGLLLGGLLWLGAWWRGTRLASQAVRAFDGLARGLDMVRCGPPEPPREAEVRPEEGSAP